MKEETFRKAWKIHSEIRYLRKDIKHIKELDYK